MPDREPRAFWVDKDVMFRWKGLFWSKTKLRKQARCAETGRALVRRVMDGPQVKVKTTMADPHVALN